MRSFTAFHSAREEVERAEALILSKHRPREATTGRTVRTPSGNFPSKAILTHDDMPETEFDFATVRECEAFIRRNTPSPPARNTLFDRPGQAST